MISVLKNAIPDSVQQRWHEWRAAVKGVEKEQLGDNHVSEDIEKVGWGVEEAQERNKTDASKSQKKNPSWFTQYPRFLVHDISPICVYSRLVFTERQYFMT